MDNESKKERRITFLILILACLAVLAAILLEQFLTASRASYLSNSDVGAIVEVTNLDVGKGDAAVIRYKNHVGIIDTGAETSYPVIDAWLKDHGIVYIDFMVLSHFDQDHVGGAMKLMQYYTVANVYYPDYQSDKHYYEMLMTELTSRDGAAAIAKASEFSLEDMTVELYPAEDVQAMAMAEGAPDNNMSLLCRISFGTEHLLFTGDIEKERMEELLDSSVDYSAGWIKLPHHGAYDKNEKDFLKHVKPELAVISTSLQSPPDERLLEYLEKKEITYYVTTQGNITTVCDGTSIRVEQ